MKPYFEALRQMVLVLNQVKVEGYEFDLSMWAGPELETFFMNWPAKKSEASDLTEVPHLCGTSACACGYAALAPWFRERHLVLNEVGMIVYRPPDGIRLKKGKSVNGQPTGTHFPQLYSWDAVYHFFQLEIHPASVLFSDMYYKDGTDLDAVIARLEDFIQTLEGNYTSGALAAWCEKYPEIDIDEEISSDQV